MRAVGDVPRDLLGRLTCFVVEHWGGSSSGDMSMVDRATGNLLEAHVASSKVRTEPIELRVWGHAEPVATADGPDLHKVVIDVDHEAYLVPSSTPGHHHLYVDIPPVAWDDYVAWLRASAKIGLVEQGYVDASIRRGHSDVRLPWVQKGDTGDFLPKRPMLRCSYCKRPGHEIAEYREGVLSERTDETMDEPITNSDVLDWIWHNEGTLNRDTGFFSCTECYVKIGMPSAECGWTAPAPEPVNLGTFNIAPPAPGTSPAPEPFDHLGPYGNLA